MSIRILTDSTCDLSADVIEQYQIEVVPAYVNIGEESMTDGIELTREAFYSNISSYRSHPTTAAPAPGMFAESYEKLKSEGATTVIAIHVASQLSAFLNSSRLGSESVEGLDVRLVDSGSVSLGLGLQVQAAAQMIEDGESADDIITVLESMAKRTVVYASADTLEFLRRSGRVGLATAGIGSLLKIKPILQVKDGVASSFDRVRTRKKVQPKLVELAKGLGELEAIGIVHSGNGDRANSLARALGETLGTQNLLVALIGPAIGAHIGPDAIGFACIKR